MTSVIIGTLVAFALGLGACLIRNMGNTLSDLGDAFNKNVDIIKNIIGHLQAEIHKLEERILKLEQANIPAPKPSTKVKAKGRRGRDG